jgi:hypothetical protein
MPGCGPRSSAARKPSDHPVSGRKITVCISFGEVSIAWRRAVAYADDMSMWFSIEVLDGAVSASVWSEAHRDALIESALLNRATDWNWHRHTWGVVLELAFGDEAAWDRFRALPAVQAALDAVPDPISGLIMYPGRGGSAGNVFPRRPKPLAGAGSAALPLPWDLWDDDESSIFWPSADRKTPAAGLALTR